MNNAEIDTLKTRLAEVERERDEVIATLKWTDEVYPARIEAGGAGVQLTWDEFDAMRSAAGFRPVNRIGDKEGRAGFNHRLRSRALTAESRCAALVKEACEVVEAFDWCSADPFDRGYSTLGDAIVQLRTALADVVMDEKR